MITLNYTLDWEGIAEAEGNSKQTLSLYTGRVQEEQRRAGAVDKGKMSCYLMQEVVFGIVIQLNQFHELDIMGQKGRNWKVCR
jgi:hypothetical protein